MVDITKMYREIFRDPLDTLRRNLLVAGKGTHGAGLYEAGQNVVKGFTTGLSGLRGAVKDRDRYDFAYKGTADGGFDLTKGQLHAFYFPMNQDVKNLTPVATRDYLDIPRLAMLRTPKVVWTGQLSACHIGIWKKAPSNTIRLCHVQPMKADQARLASLPDTDPKIHDHIDKQTMPLIGALCGPCSILVRPKMGLVHRATGDQLYFVGLYIEKEWRFFVTHKAVTAKMDVGGLTKVVELKDGVYEY
jgi:hypothetical protein